VADVVTTWATFAAACASPLITTPSDDDDSSPVEGALALSRVEEDRSERFGSCMPPIPCIPTIILLLLACLGNSLYLLSAAFDQTLAFFRKKFKNEPIIYIFQDEMGFNACLYS
jgi:hypothetical protein